MLARSFAFCPRFPASGPLTLMKNHDDDRNILSTHKVSGVRKIVEQRTSYAVSDLRKLIRKSADSFNRSRKVLYEPNATSMIVACVPRLGFLDVRIGKVPDNNADHSLLDAPFRSSARTSSHGRLAFGLA